MRQAFWSNVFDFEVVQFRSNVSAGRNAMKRNIEKTPHLYEGDIILVRFCARESRSAGTQIHGSMSGGKKKKGKINQPESIDYVRVDRPYHVLEFILQHRHAAEQKVAVFT